MRYRLQPAVLGTDPLTQPAVDHMHPLIRERYATLAVQAVLDLEGAAVRRGIDGPVETAGDETGCTSKSPEPCRSYRRWHRSFSTATGSAHVIGARQHLGFVNG